MPPPIETYYSGSPEEQQDLLELRKDYYRTLRVLERRAATYGDAGVPAQVATAIADAKANIRAIDEALRSPIDSSTAERLGATGQFNVLAVRLDLLSQQVRLSQDQADEWRATFRATLDDLADDQRAKAAEWREALNVGFKALTDQQSIFQRVTRNMFQAIGAVLFILALTLIGLGAALWSLR